MINFYESEDFTRTVYTVDYESREIVECTLGDLCCEWAERTTSPRGVETKFHTRGCELWTWGPQGNFPAKVDAFDTEGEAYHAMMLCHRHDLYNSDNTPCVHDTYTEAEADLAEWMEEQDG